MFALKRATGGLLLAAILATTGCASLKSAQPPLPASNPVAVDPVFNAAAETELPLEFSPDSMFVLLRAQSASSASVPDIAIKDISFTEVGVQDAVRLVAAQAGLTVRVEGGSLGSERYGPVTVENLSGSVASVLDAMADAVGFFWEIKGKTLIIRQDDRFMVNLPPVLSEDTLAGITNTMQYLGARDVYLDRAGRTLVFSANRKGMDSVQRYLDSVRATRSLLVYDTHIFQVELNDGLNTGIQWNAFAHGIGGMALGSARTLNNTTTTTLAADGSSSAAGTLTNTLASTGAAMGWGATAGASGVNLTYTSNAFSLTTLLNFLTTQGAVKSLSSPQITMLSNSKGSLRVGKTITYVSKVGSNTTTGISQVTTETSSLRTGLKLELLGDLYDKTVVTRVTLAISDVTDMVKFTAIGTDLTLPQSADRDLDVTVRSRPGDVILLGGIHTDMDNKSSQRGITGFSDGASRVHSELVLVLKARVIKFVDKNKPAEVVTTPLAVN